MRAARVAASSLALLATIAAAGCAANDTPNDAAVCYAYRHAGSHVEVVADGTVTRVLGVAPGIRSPHEGFLMKIGSGCDLVVRVEANTDFAGTFPLTRGDRVVVKGEYEFYQLGGVIHWTHRDPRGIHPDGFVETGGQRHG